MELVVAEKEFRDHLTSKRFLAIVGIMLLLALYGVSTGMDDYDHSLGLYKGQLAADNVSVQPLSGGLSRVATTIVMPSILDVFQGMIPVFSFLGMVLGVAMGFDQISGEKEEGSLKLLATCPIYRDAIINGKAIGAVATLALAMAATFLVSLAIVMFRDVVPGFDDLLRISAFFLAALLYSVLFYALGTMMSIFTRNTSTSIIYAIGLIVALITFSLLAVIISAPIASAIAGQAPASNPAAANYAGAIGSSGSPGAVVSSGSMNYSDKLTVTENQVTDMLTTISPFDDFGGSLGMGESGIGKAILTKSEGQSDNKGEKTGGSATAVISLQDSLASVWARLLAMIAELVVAFALSYLAFMRMDL